MLTFKQFLEEEKKSEYVRSPLDVNFINLLDDFSTTAYSSNINTFVSCFDNESSVVFEWTINDARDILYIEGKVSNCVLIDSINLTSWNVENISRILLDSGLLVNPNKQDLLKEKLNFQDQTANDWLSYGYEFSKPNDKYLMWIVASELYNGYNLGLKEYEKSAKVIETPKGYNVIIKPIGTNCCSPIIVVVRMEENKLSLEIGYNFLQTFFIQLKEENFETFRKEFKLAMEKFLQTKDYKQFVERLNWFGYSKAEKTTKILESGGTID